MKTIASAIILTSLSSLSLAQVTSSKAGYLLQAKFKKGQVTKVSMMAKAPDYKNVINSTTRVLNVEPDGSAKIQVTVPSQDNIPSQKDVVYLDKFGTTKDGKLSVLSGIMSWPNKPYKIGQEWYGDVNLGENPAGDIPLQATYRMIGVKAVNGVKVMRINANFNLKAYNMSGNGYMNVRMDNGLLLNSDLLMTMVVPDDKKKGKNKQVKLQITVNCKS